MTIDIITLTDLDSPSQSDKPATPDPLDAVIAKFPVDVERAEQRKAQQKASNATGNSDSPK